MSKLNIQSLIQCLNHDRQNSKILKILQIVTQISCVQTKSEMETGLRRVLFVAASQRDGAQEQQVADYETALDAAG